jgi:hypothetical protein
MTRKRRSDASPLDQFREQLDVWLYDENKSYKEVMYLLETECSFKVSRSALWSWKQERDQERLIEKIARDSRRSNEAVEAFAQENPQLESAFTNLLRQVAFNLVSSPDPDPKAITMIAGHALKLRDQELKARELALKEEALQVSTCEAFIRWHKDQRAREIADGKGSNAEKIAALRQRMFADVEAAAK